MTQAAPMPQSIEVGPFTYIVSSDEIDILRAQDREGSARWGHSSHTGLKIVVATVEEAEMRQRVTLAHEWLHALTSMVGLYADLGNEMDEKVVTRLAPALVDGLRRNPELVAYLTADA